MTDDPHAPQNAPTEPTSGRRRFLVEGVGLVALGALATVPVDRPGALAALRGRWRALRLASATPRPAPGVTARRDGDELVVSIPGADPGVALNETAARVFTACDGHHTVGAIARDLCRRYRVPESRARADAVAVVEALTRAGCLAVG